MGLHAFTGCDSVSAFKGKGKIKALKMLLSPKYSRYLGAFQDLGTNWDIDEALVGSLEGFTCSLYGSTKCDSIDELRLLSIKSKCRDKDMSLSIDTKIDFLVIPPSKACLVEHIKRSNYQTRLWRLAYQAMQNVPKPWHGHGWQENGEPMWCPQNKILPPSLTDILSDSPDTSNESEEEEDETFLISEEDELEGLFQLCTDNSDSDDDDNNDD